MRMGKGTGRIDYTLLLYFMSYDLDQIITGLQVAIAVMVIVLLYHGIFIVVDLRKVMRRVNDVTQQVEDMVMKPISMADHVLSWVVDYIEEDKKKKKGKSKKKAK